MTVPETEYLAGKYLDMVYRLALNALRSPADAEDAAQAAMLRLCRRPGGFESEEHARNWLVRVTLNECRRLAVSPWRRRNVALSDFEDTLPFEDPEESALYGAVMGLPPDYRVAVYLHYYEGYSVKETAAMTGSTVTAVTTRLSRAREKLRHTLEEAAADER